MNVRMLLFLVLVISTNCQANIYRWDTRRVIPGTELIELGSAAEFLNLDLEHAQVCCSLFESNFSGSNLSHARFWTKSVFGTPSADLTNAIFDYTRLTNASLHHANLSGVSLIGADLSNAGIFSPSLESAIVDGSTIYNQWTRFPDDFDPIAAGLTLREAPAGDFDANGVVNVEDLDLLQVKIRDGFSAQEQWKGEKFDLNFDAAMNDQDLSSWVRDLKQTYFGDANLDGEFNSVDLVEVFGAGHYEDAIDGVSGWADGDWNADGDFDSSDLIVALADGGYERGPRVVFNAVPEPTSAVLLLLSLLALNRRRK